MFFSSIFAVPKPNVKSRLVLDLSKLNLMLKCESFNMENVTSIAATVSNPLWGIFLDMKDVYFQVPKSMKSGKFLGSF